MAKIMDNDNALHDDEPTAELPALTEADIEEASATVVDLEKSERRKPRRAKSSNSTVSVAGDDDHNSLSARLKKAVQDYVEQG